MTTRRKIHDALLLQAQQVLHCSKCNQMTMMDFAEDRAIENFDSILQATTLGLQRVCGCVDRRQQPQFANY